MFVCLLLVKTAFLNYDFGHNVFPILKFVAEKFDDPVRVFGVNMYVLMHYNITDAVI